MRERGYQVRFSVNVWVGIVGSNGFGPYLLTNRLTAERQQGLRLSSALKQMTAASKTYCNYDAPTV
jgi:hypothetical protein